MTQIQHIKAFKSSGGKSAVEKIEEFITDPKVNAITITTDGKNIYLLYHDNL
jgi:hypothetical protein